MNSFSSWADGWCSLQSSLSSRTTFPSWTSALARSYPVLFSFTAMISASSSSGSALYQDFANLRRQLGQGVVDLVLGHVPAKSASDGARRPLRFGRVRQLGSLCEPGQELV